MGNLACLCGYSPWRQSEGNVEGCHKKHHRGAIEFKRACSWVDFDGASVFDDIWNESMEEFGG
jgi:hypothetical protein